MSFFAHHCGLLASSLAEKGVAPLLTFLWLCEHADENGVVHDARPKRIATELSLVSSEIFTPAAVGGALATLQEPDEDSKRRDAGGKRIVPHPSEGSAFVIVNFLYYNEEYMTDRRLKKQAARQRRYDARKRAESGSDKATDASLTQPDVSLTPSVLSTQYEERRESPSASRLAPATNLNLLEDEGGSTFVSLGISELPFDWLIASLDVTEADELNLSHEFSKFAEYYISTGEKKRDWMAAFLGCLKDVPGTRQAVWAADLMPAPDTSRTSPSPVTKVEKKPTAKVRSSFKDLGVAELPAEWLAAAQAKGVSPDEACRQFERFSDHYLANGEVRADWLASWRSWLGKREDFAPKNASPVAAKCERPPVTTSPDLERIRQAKLEEARKLQARG